jgi:hypothetical protein
MTRDRWSFGGSWLVAVVVFGLSFSSTTVRGSSVVLNFEDVLASEGSDTPFFTPIETQGFTLTATNPPTGFSSGFEAHGPDSIFYAGAVGITTFAPATSPPDNVIELSRTDGQAFDLLSIDLARNFAFDPAPTVHFVGIRADGSTVEQSFTVTVPVGTAEFETFAFSGFSGVTSVSWGQPQLSDGLHQFTDIVIAGAVPEPSTLGLLAAGLSISWTIGSRRGRASRTAGA